MENTEQFFCSYLVKIKLHINKYKYPFNTLMGSYIYSMETTSSKITNSLKKETKVFQYTKPL